MPDHFELEETSRGNAPTDELDLYAELLRSQVSDEWLERNNLGTGNYSDAEMWQQIESYSAGLHADAALSRTLIERAVAHAREGVALNGFTWVSEDGANTIEVDGWVDLDEEERQRLDRQRWFDREEFRKWDRLPRPAKLEAIEVYGQYSGRWTPPFWQMASMRHEASRSRGARLLDNITGRVREKIFGGDRPDGALDATTNGHGGHR